MKLLTNNKPLKVLAIPALSLSLLIPGATGAFAATNLTTPVANHAYKSNTIDFDNSYKVAYMAAVNAENSKTLQTVEAAQKAINAIPKGIHDNLIQNLQTRLTHVRFDVTYGIANQAVNATQQYKTVEKVNTAQKAINAIPKGIHDNLIQNLQTRLTHVRFDVTYGIANQAVNATQQIKTVEKVNTAQKAINAIPKGIHDNLIQNLQTRLTQANY